MIRTGGATKERKETGKAVVAVKAAVLIHRGVPNAPQVAPVADAHSIDRAQDPGEVDLLLGQARDPKVDAVGQVALRTLPKEYAFTTCKEPVTAGKAVGFPTIKIQLYPRRRRLRKIPAA